MTWPVPKPLCYTRWVSPRWNCGKHDLRLIQFDTVSSHLWNCRTPRCVIHFTVEGPALHVCTTRPMKPKEKKYITSMSLLNIRGWTNTELIPWDIHPTSPQTTDLSDYYGIAKVDIVPPINMSWNQSQRLTNCLNIYTIHWWSFMRFASFQKMSSKWCLATWTKTLRKVSKPIFSSPPLRPLKPAWNYTVI